MYRRMYSIIPVSYTHLPHFQKDFCKGRIRCQFSADPGPDPGFLGVFCHICDEPQDRRMTGIVKIIQPVILPVRRQGVLGQIVGADAEKIHLFRQLSA